MTKDGQSICLSMIVKNEEPVIRRCLESVKPLIDYWVIVDTGSSDRTKDIILDCMGNIPGELHDSAWKNFAHNRSEALTLARPHGSYSFVIDADDVLELPQQFARPTLEADAYAFTICDGSLSYPRIQLVKSSLDWSYRGVLHEFINSDRPHEVARLDLTIRRNHDGARRRNPNTYEKDAEILQTALATENDPFFKTRYTFYLAQSFRDSKNLIEAVKFYEKRSQMGGWNEEVYYSLYQIGRLKEMLGYPVQEILEAYRCATIILPSRNEARYAASRLCRINKLYQEGYQIAQTGINLPFNSESLFGEPWVYTTGLLDEFAVNAYWVQCYADSLEACLRILERPEGLSLEDHSRVVSNAQAAFRMMNDKSLL